MRFDDAQLGERRFMIQKKSLKNAKEGGLALTSALFLVPFLSSKFKSLDKGWVVNKTVLGVL